MGKRCVAPEVEKKKPRYGELREFLTTVDWDNTTCGFQIEEDSRGTAVGLEAIDKGGIFERE